MWIRFSGIAGLVIFLFGFIAAFLVQSFSQPLLLLHMILGVVLLGVWVFGYGFSNLEQAGEVLRGRTTRFGANAVLYTVVFLAFLIIINWFAHKYDRHWDLTENGVFSLSEQSVSVLKSLKKPLKIVAFKGVSQDDEVTIKELLDLYKYNAPSLIETKVVDARTKPHLLDQYEMKQGNVVYLEYGEGEKKGVSRVNEANEQALTNAIIKLARGEAKKVYYVVGHNEPDLTSDAAPDVKNLAQAISDEHLTVEPILLAEKPVIPEDAAAVILASPKKPFLKEEKETLIKYGDEGGRLLLMTDPRTTSDVKDIAAHFEIEVGDNVVIDQIQRLFAAPALGAQPVIRDYTPHFITRNLKARDVTVFNIASTVKALGKSGANSNWTELMKTGASAWGETDLNRLFDEENPSSTFDRATDLAGPVPMAVAFEKKFEDPTANKDEKKTDDAKFKKITRIVVFGDTDWILNANIAVYSNRDFFLSALNWVVGEEGGVSIGKKSIRRSDALMTQEDFLFLLASSFLIPEFILILGLFIWWRRKTIGA